MFVVKDEDKYRLLSIKVGRSFWSGRVDGELSWGADDLR